MTAEQGAEVLKHADELVAPHVLIGLAVEVSGRSSHHFIGPARCSATAETAAERLADHPRHR